MSHWPEIRHWPYLAAKETGKYSLLTEHFATLNQRNVISLKGKARMDIGVHAPP